MIPQNIKDEVARKNGYLSWDSLRAHGAAIECSMLDEVAELYAERKVKKLCNISVSVQRELLINFNNNLSRYQRRLPSEIIVEWNELFEKFLNSR